MFQKVGLLDIFIGLWNRKKSVLLIACVAAIIGSIVTLATVFVRSNENEDTYYKSIVLYIDTTKKTEGVDLISQAQKIRATYMSLYDTALFSEYLQNVAGASADAPLSEYLLPAKNTEQVSAVIPDSNILDIYRSLTISGPSNASTIIISFECTDTAVGNAILDATYRFADEVLKEKIPYSTVTEIGRTDYQKPAFDSAESTFANIVISCVKNAIAYCVAFEFVYILIAVFIILFRPVVNFENDIRQYGDVPVFTFASANQKESVSAEAVSFARFIIRNFGGKFLGFAGTDARDSQDSKNNSIKDLYRSLTKLGKKTLLVNFDPQFSADFPYTEAKVDPDSECYEYACDFEALPAENYDIILMNFCSASDKGYLLSSDLPVDDMVLEINLGKSTHRDMERSVDNFKQNNMNLFAVMAAK